jgi:hypothetical protein
MRKCNEIKAGEGREAAVGHRKVFPEDVVSTIEMRESEISIEIP